MSALCGGWDFYWYVAFDGGYLDFFSFDGVEEGDDASVVDIKSFSFEDVVFYLVDKDDEVAWDASMEGGVSFACF